METAPKTEITYLGQCILKAANLLGNGNACTQMGAIEAHAKAITEAADRIAQAIEILAEKF